MIRIGLVDDQRYDLEKLIAITSSLDDVEVVFATANSEEAYDMVKKKKIDLFIADIEMPGLSGYELADLIQSHALDIAVIFVTAHSGYAVHAFELNVHDYILKPYTKERLLKSLERYREKRTGAEEHGRLVIKQKSEIHFIRKKEIIFIERTGRSTTIYTVNGTYETYQPLNDLEGQLSSRSFLRSHRSYIINIHYVKNFSLFSKNTYSVSFHNTNHRAFITKDKMEDFQNRYF